MADLGDKLRHVFHLLDNIIHRAACGVNLLRAGLHLAGAGINEFTNIIGGTGASAGEMAHFARDHGKTFSLLSCPCRFNRRVQRQNIGLESDIVNQGGNRANSLRAVGNVIHVLTTVCIALPPFVAALLAATESLSTSAAVQSYSDGSGHLVHCRDGLLHVRHGLTRAIVQVFISLRQPVAAVTDAYHLARHVID